MHATLEKVFGYRGDNMNLPVADVAAAVPFYETVLGFTVTSRTGSPQQAAVLARDLVQMRLVENGGDPTQDGCAFHVQGLTALCDEFRSRGLQKQLSDIDVERRNDGAWNVFYVVAPDGLCYWFGEKQAS